MIASGSLQLRLIRVPRGGGQESTFRLHRVLKQWAAEATWANASSTLAWSVPGGVENVDYSTNSIPGEFLPGSGDFAFEGNGMAADITDWIRNPATNHGWFLISDREATSFTARHFGSSASESPPQLSIRYSVPADGPTIRGTARESTNFVFAIDGVAGWIYNIETRDDVDRGLWTTFTNAPAGAGLTPIVITVPMTNPHQFFRAFRD